MLQALVDTGSGYTLIQQATTVKLECEVDSRRISPNLQGVTENPLRILGMVWLKVAVDDGEIVERWFPVVPDNYVSTDILLGCDLLELAPVTWCIISYILLLTLVLS